MPPAIRAGLFAQLWRLVLIVQDMQPGQARVDSWAPAKFQSDLLFPWFRTALSLSLSLSHTHTHTYTHTHTDLLFPWFRTALSLSLTHTHTHTQTRTHAHTHTLTYLLARTLHARTLRRTLYDSVWKPAQLQECYRGRCPHFRHACLCMSVCMCMVGLVRYGVVWHGMQCKILPCHVMPCSKAIQQCLACTKGSTSTYKAYNHIVHVLVENF